MMMKIETLIPGCIGLALGCALVSAATAKIPPEDIARLGQDLTPVGAERAGNADGSIPDWTGGTTEPPAGYTPGGRHVDPYPDDEPLFTVSGANLGEHRDRLSAGHQRLLELYPSFRMPIYPTRRGVNFPQRIGEATRRIALTAELVDGGNGVDGAAVGVPFPIPSNGLEAIWNHLLRYRGTSLSCLRPFAVVDRDGSYTMVTVQVDALFRYHLPEMTPEALDNKTVLFRQANLAPPRLAGNLTLVHETMNQVRQKRRTWTYNLGQRRVMRVPDPGYDYLGAVGDGLQTSDQRDMFSGAIDRYEWRLLGKRELYVPYNGYRQANRNLAVDDVLGPLHLNPEHSRYELHRVWVVEATLRESARHIYKRRTLYLDEDSWAVLVADIYDNRDQLWRVSENHLFHLYGHGAVVAAKESHMDLLSGRYLVVGANNDTRRCEWEAAFDDGHFTPGALRRAGR